MKKVLHYRVKPGCGDFNEEDWEKWEEMVGTFRRKIESGWLAGCILLRFPDGEEEVFFADDLEFIGAY